MKMYIFTDSVRMGARRSEPVAAGGCGFQGRPRHPDKVPGAAGSLRSH